MKRLFTLTMVIIITFSAFAQAPQKMSYQCVVRDAGGILVTNHSIGLRVSILHGTPTGTVVYQETYNPNPQTNANGLLSIEIGGGLAITGTFSAIDWASGPYFLKTETDPAGGTNYTIVGTSQLLSVPYALYSNMTANLADNSVTSAKILDGTIANADLADGSITSAKIVDGSVSTTDLANNSVTSAKIADGSVATVDLAYGSVTSAKLADGSVSNAKLADGSVNSIKIADGSVATADVANSAITTSKISSSGASTNYVLQYNGSSVTWGYAPGSILKYTVIDVSCAAVASFTATYVKIADIGTISKVDATSDLEITFNGRIYVNSLTGTGAHFEIRVDNTATTNGRARAVIKASEIGSSGIPASISGLFTGFGAGSHTISI